MFPVSLCASRNVELSIMAAATASAAAARPSSTTEVYAGPEFSRWAHAQGLIPAERFLIEKYLNAAGATLEAGTGGGRILRALADRGYRNLAGFDSVPSLIEEARLQDSAGRIQFTVQKAQRLSYADASFDQAIYLQQITSFIADPEGREKAAAEASRVLKPGGTAIFSFLLFEARLQSVPHLAMMAYLATFRFFAGRRISIQAIPWLSHQGKFNRDALLDRPPHVYWFRCLEAGRLLSSHGFNITGIGTLPQIREGRLCSSVQELLIAPMEGMLYVVCSKRAPAVQSQPGYLRTA